MSLPEKVPPSPKKRENIRPKEFKVLYYGLESCLHYLKKIYPFTKNNSSLSFDTLASSVEFSSKSTTIWFILKSLKDFQFITVIGSMKKGKILISENGLHALTYHTEERTTLLKNMAWNVPLYRFYLQQREQGETSAYQAVIDALEQQEFSKNSIKISLKALKALKETNSFLESLLLSEKINSYALLAREPSMGMAASLDKEEFSKEQARAHGDIHAEPSEQIRIYDEDGIEHRIMAAGRINYEFMSHFFRSSLQWLERSKLYPF